MRTEHREFPRRFEEFANQYSASGWCHGLGFDKDRRPVAILEYDGGEVLVRRLDEHYSVRFVNMVEMNHEESV